MTNSQPDFIRGYQPEGGAWAPTNSHRGRPGSWVAVVFLLVGFTAAGVSLAMGPAWWVMGAGALLMVVGAILCFVTDIFTDVVLDDPHRDLEERHTTPLHRIKRQLRGGGGR